MALCTTQAPFNLLSGAFADRTSAAGCVANPTFGRNVLRDYVIPANPNTGRQQLVRGYFTSCATAFSQLTQSQISPWNDLAAAIERSGRLGLPYNPTGQNMFVGVNWIRLLAGQAIDNTPPALELLPGLDPETVDGVWTSGAPDVASIDWTDSLPAGSFVLVRATRRLPTPARNGRINEAILPTLPASGSLVLSSAETVELAQNLLQIQEDNSIGVSLQSVSSGYLPGARIFLPRVLLDAP